MNLTAISPATKTVALGSAAVEVTGLSMRKLTRLIIAYPELVAIVAGGQIEIGPIIVKSPDMSLAIFSLAIVGQAQSRFWRRMQSVSDDELCRAFDIASAGQQIEVIAAIYDLTFKGGERAIPLLKSVIASLATPTKNSDGEPEPSNEPEPIQSENATSQEHSPSASSD